MNRREYMYELRRELDGLPFQDREDAIRYYEEYFEDAGPENEENVVNEIGAPQEVAKQILEEFKIKDISRPAKTPKQGFAKIWQVILLIFASPIALPLAIAVVAVVFSLVIAVLAVIIAFAATGLALFLSGVVFIIAGCVVITQGLATMFFFIGMGLALIGIGFVIGYFSVYVGAKMTSALARSLNNFLNKHNTKKEGKRI